MSEQDITNLLILILPILLVQLGVMGYVLLDLRKRKAVRGQRWVWALLMVFTAFAVPGGLLVAAFYLVWGRNPLDHEGNEQESQR